MREVAAIVGCTTDCKSSIFYLPLDEKGFGQSLINIQTDISQNRQTNPLTIKAKRVLACDQRHRFARQWYNRRTPSETVLNGLAGFAKISS